MPKNISFAMTTQQIIRRTKDVTRRDGWLDAKTGDRLRPVNKCMGFRKGEKPVALLPANWLIEIVSVRREPLDCITDEDVVREGFPGMTPAEFVRMYRRHGDKAPDGKVSRIEFRYIHEGVNHSFTVRELAACLRLPEMCVWSEVQRGAIGVFRPAAGDDQISYFEAFAFAHSIGRRI